MLGGDLWPRLWCGLESHKGVIVVKIVMRFATVAAMVAISVSGAAAVESKCKAMVTATGAAAPTRKGAQNKAITNWRRAVIAKYGEFYGDFDKAHHANAEQCGQTLVGLYRCEARGRPCLEHGGVASCEGKSSRCDTGVLEVQLLLKKKGCPVEIEDGIEGKDTRNALKCFQRKEGLPVTGEADSRTRHALLK
jgi:hypothetical protein